MSKTLAILHTDLGFLSTTAAPHSFTNDRNAAARMPYHEAAWLKSQRKFRALNAQVIVEDEALDPIIEGEELSLDAGVER